MNLPHDFREFRPWPAVLDERTQIPAEPAVYALMHEQPFGRLLGESAILYVGSTGELGGKSDRCRLRIYKYPNGNHAQEIRRRIQALVESGINVMLYWWLHASKAEASKAEGRLLQQYEAEHGELPPFNMHNERRL